MCGYLLALMQKKAIEAIASVRLTTPLGREVAGDPGDLIPIRGRKPAGFF